MNDTDELHDQASGEPPSGAARATHQPAARTLGSLVLVPTPLGNLADLSARATEALRSADLLLCEDTRVTSRLLAALGIVGASLSPLHEHNEDARIAGVLDAVRRGSRVALVSDAGMPLLSDPGYRLVRAAIAAGLAVEALPGPHAGTLALVLSGLPPHPALFMGFPPPRGAARRGAFAALRAAERAGLRATQVWYEAPHRLAETLEDLRVVFGERPAAVARELTKRFEEVRRGDLAALATHYAAHPARGEVTLVVGPAEGEAAAGAAGTDDGAVDAALRVELAGGATAKEAVARVTAATGLPRRVVYARVLRLSGQEPA